MNTYTVINTPAYAVEATSQELAYLATHLPLSPAPPSLVKSLDWGNACGCRRCGIPLKAKLYCAETPNYDYYASLLSNGDEEAMAYFETPEDRTAFQTNAHFKSDVRITFVPLDRVNNNRLVTDGLYPLRMTLVK